jgi:hypothetical protein
VKRPQLTELDPPKEVAPTTAAEAARQEWATAYILAMVPQSAVEVTRDMQREAPADQRAKYDRVVAGMQKELDDALDKVVACRDAYNAALKAGR